VNKYFLKKLNISLDQIPDIDNQIFNKIPSMKRVDIDIVTGTPVLESEQTRYITGRLGKGFNVDDYDRFKIVWDMNTIIPYITDIRIRNTLPNNWNSISFLSDDKSTLLTRFFDGSPRWKKTKLFPSENKSFYTIKTTLDLFTRDPIVVNIAEGVFDILSVYKNFNGRDTSLHISTLGSDYESGVNYAISSGFMGSNVTLKVYVDRDIDEKKLRQEMKKYKWWFNNVYIYKNMIQEDFGVPIDKIKKIEYQV